MWFEKISIGVGWGILKTTSLKGSMTLNWNSPRGGGRGSNKNKTFYDEGMGFFWSNTTHLMNNKTILTST